MSQNPNSPESAPHESTIDLSGVWFYQPGSGIEEWSRSLETLLDIARQPGRSLFDLFPELDHRLRNAVHSRDTASHFESVLASPSKPFSFQLEIRYAPNGDPERVIGVIRSPSSSRSSRDATSNKTVHHILEAFAQSPGSVVFATDTEGNYTFLSGQGLKYLGMSPVEWIGKSIFDFLQDVPKYQATIRRVLKGEFFYDESCFGGHYFEDRFCPVYGPHGDIRGLVGIQTDITDKVLATRDLKEKTDLMTSLFDGIPDSAFILDLDYKIIQVNAAAKEAFSGNPLLGCQCHHSLRGNSAPCEFCPVVETYRTGKAATREYHERETDRFFELSSFPIRSHETAEIVGATAFIRDITLQKRIEETSHRNEAFLNTLMEVLTDGIYLIDTSYTITRCNKKVNETYPHLAPLVGKKCYETTCHKRVCPDCAAETMFREGKVATRTFFEKNSEDEPGGWFELTAFPQYDVKTGRINGAICIVRDITPRIEMESRLDEYRMQIQKMAEMQMDELRMSEARLRSILETSGVAISFSDSKGRFSYINNMYREMLGYPEEELYGKHLTGILVPDEEKRRECMELIDRAFHSNNGRFRTTQELLRKNGRVIWGDINVSVIHGNRPEETQMISVIVDVTAQQEWSRRLSQAKTAAEEASEAKSQFLATMSHEIRTPLNGVIGISDLLLETPLETKQLEYAKLIKASGESLLFLINDILDFSKIEAGKLELDRIEFDLHDLVESVVGILASRAAEKALELVVTFGDHVPGRVLGDPGRLRQILINLVGNGLKFTNAGGVRTHVTLRKRAGEKVEVRFDVSDTGIGIPRDRIGRLFKRFSQVDTSSARVYGGTGLGLAICKKLVELMGGTIHVESEEGKGSTFWFTIALDVDDRSEKTAAGSRSGLTRERSSAMPWSGNVALIACDNAIQLPALLDQLELWGFQVKPANSSVEAMLFLRNTTSPPVALVVVDSAFENHAGERFVRAVQDDDVTAGTSVVFLAPLSEEPQKKGWRFPERLQFVSKPMQSSALLDAVVDLLLGADRIPDEEADDSDSPDVDRDEIHAETIRVLIAEDNRVNQIVISDILKNAGMDCTLAENGREAIDAIRRNRYDAVLMDCQMPLMDGYEATGMIRQWERDSESAARLPIIALTANATSEDEAKCLTAGMDAYCAKPVDPKRIVALVRHWALPTKESPGTM